MRHNRPLWLTLLVSAVLVFGSLPAEAFTRYDLRARDDLVVDDDSTLTGDVDIGGTLDVAGTLTAAGDVDVTGTFTAGTIVGGVETGTFADGTAAAPGIAFTNDTNNGFYRIGSDNFGLSVGGTKRWDYAATVSGLTGNLTVSGTAAVTGASTFTGNVGCDGGFDLDGTLFALTDATGVLSAVPTSTTGDAWTLDISTVTSGTGLKIIADDDVMASGYYAEFFGGTGADTLVWSVGEFGQQTIVCTDAATNSLYITNNAATSGDHITLVGDSDTMDADTFYMSILGTADHASQVFYIGEYGDLYAGGGQSINLAAGRKMVQGYYIGATTALTGDGVGVYGNARVTMDSSAGKVFGGYFKAGNGTTTGYDIQIIRGVYIEGVKKAGAGATVTAARGLEINMDWDAATTTTTTLTGARIEIQTGSSASAATQSAGVHITNQSVQGTGQAVEAALLVTQISCGSSQGFNYGIDFGDDGFVDDGLTFRKNAFATADIRLCGGDTIDNTTDTVIKFSERVALENDDYFDNSTATQIQCSEKFVLENGEGFCNATDNEISGDGYLMMDNQGAACTVAGGRTMITGYFLGGTNALTGDGIGVYGNARAGVDSTSGKVIGGYFKAGNGTAVAYDIDLIRGVYIEAVCKGTAESATVDSARGIEVSLDWDAPSTVTTTLTGARIEIQTGAAAEDITNSAGIHITNQSVEGAGDTIDAAILVTQLSVGSQQGFSYGLDFGDSSFGDDGLTFTNNIFETADIRLCKGDTIENIIASRIKFSERIALENDEYIENSSDGIIDMVATEVNVIGYLTSDNNATAIDSASGRTMITGYYLGGTTALTSDGIGVYGNARVEVDSTSGKVIGGYFKAGNGPSTAGFSIDGIRGVYVEAVKKTGTAKAIDYARGIEINMDWDAATTTTASLTGLRVEIQSGASASAPTHSAGIHVINQSVSGAGQKMEAAILVSQLSCGSSGGFDYGLDFGNSTGFADDGLTFVPNIFGKADIRLSGGPTISASTTAPNGTITAPKGSLHIDTDAAADAQLFINTDGSTTWEAIASG